MRLSKPRIEPLQDGEFTEEQKEALGVLAERPSIINIFRTMVRAPKAFKRFNEWGSYILSRRNDLTPHDREIVILRVGFLCRSGYEFAQHTRIGLQEGLSMDEINAIKTGAGAPNWTPAEAALIRAADELVGDHFITDATWAELGKHFTQKQCMDVAFTTGQYTQVSMFLNTFGVQLEPGVALDPDLKK